MSRFNPNNYPSGANSPGDPGLTGERSGDQLGELPADLFDISAELDRLAAAERAGVPAGLESRIFDATRKTFVQADAPVVYSFVSRADWATRLVRIAAMVAVVGGVGLAWWATRPPALPVSGGDSQGLVQLLDETDPGPEPTSPAEDEFFAVLTSGGDTLGSEIESLHSEAQRVSDSISAPSPSSWNEQPIGGFGTIDVGSNGG